MFMFIHGIAVEEAEYDSGLYDEPELEHPGNRYFSGYNRGGYFPLNGLLDPEQEPTIYGLAHTLYWHFAACCECSELLDNIAEIHLISDRDLSGLIRLAKRAVEESHTWDMFRGHKQDFKALLINLESERNRRAGIDLHSPAYGYVYLILSTTGHYKIGRSNDPTRRINQFVSSKVVLPLDFELVHTIETNNMNQLEVSLHLQFHAKRFKGEWFTLDATDVSYIKNLQRVLVE